jgi:hypothetical protein
LIECTDFIDTATMKILGVALDANHDRAHFSLMMGVMSAPHDQERRDQVQVTWGKCESAPFQTQRQRDGHPIDDGSQAAPP